MGQTVTAGVSHRIEIRGFDSFSVINRASRMDRNPRSDDPVEIPAARVPHFKLGKALHEAVDLPVDDVAPAQR
ncbi:MAG: hypothetical protein EAZ11_09550 [Curvibacter sp.]|nr:MAG: hypothetical protein EAZ11_09550 [Curvibacter sp.]